MSTDINLQDSDFEGYSVPVPVLRNFTLLGNWTGRPGDARPTLDIADQVEKVRLGHMVTFTMRGVTGINLVSGNFVMGSNLRIFASCLPGDSATAVTVDCYGLADVCYPADVVGQVLALTPRPASVPGQQRYLTGLPQPGCINTTATSSTGGSGGSNSTSSSSISSSSGGSSGGGGGDAAPQPGMVAAAVAEARAAGVALEHRCWAQDGIFVDYAIAASKRDASQKQVSLGYDLHMVDTRYDCADVVTHECIQQLGTVGCVTARLAGMLSPPPPPSPASAPADRPAPLNASGGGSGSGLPPGEGRVAAASGRGDGARLGAVLGGAIGGGAFIALAAAAALMAFRWNRSRDQGTRGQSVPQDSGAGGVARPTCGGAVTDGGDSGSEVEVVLSPNSDGGASLPIRATVKAQEDETSPPSSYQRTPTSQPLSILAASVTVSFATDAHSGHQGSSGVPSPAPVVTSAAPAVAPVECAPTVMATPDPLVPVTTLTPPRDDVRMDVRPGHEVTLLPAVLGKGAFGRVVEGVYQGRPVAVKILLDTSLGGWGLPEAADGAASSGREAQRSAEPWSGDGGAVGGQWRRLIGDTEARLAGSLAQEVAVLGRCRHPNVVTLLAACLEPPRFCLVMERCDTSLERLLFGRGPGQLLPLSEVLAIALDVAKGLEYLHPTIVHRDLKPGNVLINQPGTSRVVAKLTDFGLSRLRDTVVAPTRHPETGTPEYMAPELFSTHNMVSHKVDVYSFGVLLWTMLSGQRPWQGLQMVMIAVRVNMHRERPPLAAIPADRCPPKLRRLIKQCWEAEPERRPAAAELVKELMLVRQQVARGAGDR